MNKTELLLARLTFVKPSGAGKWIARCPAHNDRTPSLKITEVHDGRILIHCHSGCGANAILDAIGMKFDDLFPEDSFKPLWRDKHKLEHHEVVLAIANADRENGVKLSKQDLEIERRAFLASKGVK